MTFKFLCLAGDLGSIIVLTYMDNLTAGLSGCNKTSRKKLVPFIFLKIVRFSCQQGFIDLNTALKHPGICGHLISCFQKKNIIQNQLLRGDGPFFPFTQDHCLALCKDSQLIQRLFRTHFLDDSDHRIDHNNSHEHGVLIGTNQQYHNHQSQIQKVEKCKHILPYDLLIAPCVGVLIDIDFPLFNSLLYLFVCQSCHRYFLHSYVLFKDVSVLLFFPLYDTSVKRSKNRSCHCIKIGQMITSALMNSLYGLPHLYHLFICNEINLLKDSVSCKKYYSFVSMTTLYNYCNSQ